MKSLYESLLDKTERKIRKVKMVVSPEIEEFLNANYKGGSEGFLLSIKPNKDGCYVVDAEKDIVLINRNATSLTNGQFVFGSTDHSFYAENTKLKNLHGAPRYVGGNFECLFNDYLETLEGAPEIIRGDFNAYDNPALKRLDTKTKRVYGSFQIENCTDLESLKGAPKQVDGWFIYYCAGGIVTGFDKGYETPWTNDDVKKYTKVGKGFQRLYGG